MLPPLKLIPMPCRSVLLLEALFDPSHLRVDSRDAIVDNINTTMGSVSVGL
jgi:hypothetical protein